MESVKDQYEFILIDCPPSLSLLTLNGLCAAHGVIIPMQCEYFALEGLADLVNTIQRVAANLNPDLRIIGLLRVMFDARMTLQQQVSEQLVAKFGDKVFDTIIPRNVRLAEAPSYGLPGVVYDRASKGAQAYVVIWRGNDPSRARSGARGLMPESDQMLDPGVDSCGAASAWTSATYTLAARIEDASLSVSQPAQQSFFDGWLLRYSPGKAKRARSINSIGAGVLPLAEKLAHCH